jgi:hypothetical protein
LCNNNNNNNNIIIVTRMGLKTNLTKNVRRTYAAAFYIERIPEAVLRGLGHTIDVQLTDGMQDIKGSIGKVQTGRQFVSRIHHNMTEFRLKYRGKVSVFVMDKGSPKAKDIEHAVRYKDGARSAFAVPDSTEGIQALIHDNHLPYAEWRKFVANPTLVAHFKDYLCHRLISQYGSKIVVNPHNMEIICPIHLDKAQQAALMPLVNTPHLGAFNIIVDYASQFMYADNADDAAARHANMHMVTFECEEHSSMVVENSVKTQRFYSNHIKEGEMAIVYYCDQFQDKHILVESTDGDMIPILVYYFYDRINSHETGNPKSHLLLRRAGLARHPDTDYRIDEFIDINLLFQLIYENAQLKTPVPQDPILSFMTACVMSGTDFVKEYTPYIGINVLWRFYEEHAHHYPMFTLSNDDNAPLMDQFFTVRRIDVHDDMFIAFTQALYMYKYRTDSVPEARTKTMKPYVNALAKHDNDVTHASVVTAKKKRMSPQRVIRAQGRQVLWNLMYWCNAYREGAYKHVNECEENFLVIENEQGKTCRRAFSVYGFAKDATTGRTRAATFVSPTMPELLSRSYGELPRPLAATKTGSALQHQHAMFDNDDDDESDNDDNDSDDVMTVERAQSVNSFVDEARTAVVGTGASPDNEQRALCRASSPLHMWRLQHTLRLMPPPPFQRQKGYLKEPVQVIFDSH